MKFSLLLLTALLSSNPQPARSASDAPNRDSRTPILVELFTSEGCSSCPPADRYLQKLDQQPIPGAAVIVLSEHVDYWNHDGWKDPYSSPQYSERQSAYVRRLGLDSAYTPQMVVDGTSEFVGSNLTLAEEAFAKAVKIPKIAIRLSSVSVEGGAMRAHLETAVPPATERKADVYIALALNRAESQVTRGENAGHTLAHAAVVRSLQKIATLERSRALSKDIELKLDPATDPHNLRIIAFIQESSQGRVLGATEQAIAPKP